MANIDNLNFKVILDDKDFNQQIEKVKKDAKDFNTSMSDILTIKKASVKISQEEVENNRRALQAKVDEARAQEKIKQLKIKTEGVQKRVTAQVQRATSEYKNQSRILQELKGYILGYASINGVSKLLSSLVRVTGEFELQKTTLAAMLGNLHQAENVISKIQSLAIESPFQFKELTTYAKQLSAFAVPANELYDTTKMLADVSAGLGVGMDRLVLAYGQVKSAAFLRGQEVRQFTEAGIPILQELAKQFEKVEGRAVSAGEVFDKISARLVPFEMVSKVFEEMTSEGGKFFNMQEVQAETLKGKISNLKDAYEVMLNEIGSSKSGKLKNAVDWAKDLMQNYEEIGKKLVRLVYQYGIYKTALIAVGLATNTFSLANHKLLQTLVTLFKYIKANPFVAITAAVSSLAFAIYNAATGLKSYEKIQQAVTKSQKKFNQEIAVETSSLDVLFAKLRLAKEGTKEYDEAKQSIMSKYSGYISELKAEGVAVDNLASLYGKLKSKIKEASKEKFLSTATEDVEKQYSAGISEIYRVYTNYTKAVGRSIKRELMAIEKESLWQYILGDEKAFDIPEVVGARFLKNEWQVKRLKEQAKEITDAYTSALNDINSAYAVSARKTQSTNIDLSREWVKTVQSTLTKLGLNKDHNYGLWATDTTQGVKYVDDLIKRYKELGDEIEKVKPFDKSLANDLEKNKSAIEAVAKALNIDIVKLANSGTFESEETERLKRYIDVLRKLQDQYERLKLLGVSDKSIQTLFKGFYPELIAENGEEFVTGLNYLERAKNIIAEIAKSDPEEAKRLTSILDADAVGDYEKKLNDAIQSTQKYYDSLRKLATEDFNINGEGIILDVNKIATGLNSKMAEIDLSVLKLKEDLSGIDINDANILSGVQDAFEKQFGEGSWDNFYQEFVLKGEDALDKLAMKQKSFEKKLAQEKINDLAKRYVKETYFTSNIELTELSDKNFFQIRDIRKELQRLVELDPLRIPVEVQALLSEQGVDINNLFGVDLEKLFQDIDVPIAEADKDVLRLVKAIQKAGLSTEKFGATIKKVIGGDLRKLTKEETKEFMSMMKDYLGEMRSLLSSVSDFADTISNDTLKGAISGLEESLDILGSVGEKLSKGDWIGAIFSGVVSITNVILDAAAAEYELNRAIAETRNEVALLNSQKAIEQDTEFILGTDDYKKFQNAYAEAVKYHQKALKDIEKQNQIFQGGMDDNWGGGAIVGSIGAGAAVGAAIGSFIPVIGTTVGAGLGAIVGMIVGEIGAAATAANDYAMSLQSMADQIGVDLINEQTGVLDSNALKKIKETYTNLNAYEKEILNKLIANAEAFENAILEMTTYMSEMFGQVADRMANSFIESFKASGKAALEYGDIMNDVATSIAQSVIKSTLLTNIFSEEDAKKTAELLASGDTAGALETVEKAMQAAENLTPAIQSFLEKLQPFFQIGDEAQTLGNGIKGITEDTANLLASYLNAIRADVSYAKTIWERMDATTQRIATVLADFSAPSLMEYQAQIAANTYNVAMNTQSIMEYLSSVMTSEGGLTAIRTYSY